MPDVINIVEKFLVANHFDGLWNSEGECACRVGDLAPCSELEADCAAGYLAPCDCSEHDWHIKLEKDQSKVCPHCEVQLDYLPEQQKWDCPDCGGRFY